MQKLLTLLNILFFCSFTFSQQKIYTKSYEEENSLLKMQKAENDFGTITEKVSFGLSIGFNNSLEDLKKAQISPIDNTVIITDNQKMSFVLSSVISVPISFKKSVSYRFRDNKGEPMGQVHKISDFSIIGVVNLVTLQGAQSGNVFNQKLSGGLGFSYNINEDFSIGLSYEMISYRKPKDFLLELSGQEIQVNGTVLTSLDSSNNDYFFDRYAGTIAFKAIYKLTTN